MKDQHHQGPQAQAHDWRWTIPNLLVYMETLTKLWLCRAKGSEHVVLFWLVMSPWSVKNVDLLERLQRWPLGMVTNIRGRTSAARPVEAGMISLSVRVKWGIRFEAKYSWLEITKLIEIESLFLQMWTPPFEQQNSMNTIMAFQECVKDVEVGCFRISGARVKCGRGP